PLDHHVATRLRYVWPTRLLPPRRVRVRLARRARHQSRDVVSPISRYPLTQPDIETRPAVIGQVAAHARDAANAFQRFPLPGDVFHFRTDHRPLDDERPPGLASRPVFVADALAEVHLLPLPPEELLYDEGAPVDIGRQASDEVGFRQVS